LTDGREWLEADRSGGFAMGSASGIRTRRYHALLTAAGHPPGGHVVLVGGAEVWIENGDDPVFLSSHRYMPDTVYPNGCERLVEFSHEPWPTWTYAIDERRTVVHELVCEPATGDVVLLWRVVGSVASETLCVRLLVAGRGYHALHRENCDFRFDAFLVGAGNVAWQPYDTRTAVTALSNGVYRHDPVWYRQFLYEQERLRGLDHIEDLASPGIFRFTLGGGSAPAAIVLRAGSAPYGDAAGIAENVRAAESGRRARFANRLQRAADAYLVKRGEGLTVMAGYPWFTDWGRDTFISVRGLCLASGRTDDARRVLLGWADTVSEGMLPNRFADPGEAPEYNSVDASLWFIVVVGELLAAGTTSASDERRLLAVVDAIARAYARGTRYGIRCDADGLLAAGVPGMQLTWMDAKVGDRVITPRTGKAVEIQALWINALAVAERLDLSFAKLRKRALESFRARFTRNDGTLYDVVDVDHVSGKNDASFRPNQIFAAGGLPIALLDAAAARPVVDAVEARLWTPCGLRTLAPDDPAYCGHYDGGVAERDGAYHQGTVWPWLAGPFIEAWVRVRGGTDAARNEASRRFVLPLRAKLDAGGLGHLFEIADGDAPHTPRGAPFQAWSLGELLRISSLVGARP
jgi:predicted glycogen debranching enzyme